MKITIALWLINLALASHFVSKKKWGMFTWSIGTVVIVGALILIEAAK